MMIEFRVSSCELRENSRDPKDRRSAISLRTTRSSQLATRHAVTLIELLITITIVATLSATFLGVSRLAMESGRAARTKTTIAKLHGLLMEKWAEYETRRVDISQPLNTALRSNIVGPPGLPGLSRSQQLRVLGEARADLRLLAVRELIKLEMPDRWSDIIGDTVGNVLPTANDNAFVNPAILSSRPALTSSYLRRYRSLPTTNINDLQSNQGAECLYLIVMLSTADGEARTLFSEQDIGDTDGDGALEFLDGWGRPIHFIRWPAGFSTGPLMSGDADGDHDPFDPFRRDQEGVMSPFATNFPGTAILGPRAHMQTIRDRNNIDVISAYRLVPLIYSAGPDGETDIDDLVATIASLDPYAIDPITPPAGSVFVSGVSNFVFGLPKDLNNDGDDNSIDNIHNHLQDNK